MKNTRAYVLYVIFSAVSIIYYFYLVNIVNIVALYLSNILIIVLRFLAGFGILSMLFAITTYIFKHIPKDYRKTRYSYLIVKVFVVIVIIASIALPVWTIISMIFSRINISPISLLIGIYSFIITMYVIPTWREEIPLDESFFLKIIEKLGTLKRKIKKAYYKYFTRDLLKAYSVDFLYLKARLDELRLRIAWKILPVLIIITLSIPPAMMIIVISSWRIMKDKYTTIDKIFFIATILLIATHMAFLMINIPVLLPLWSIPYALGALISIAMFIDALVSLLK